MHLLIISIIFGITLGVIFVNIIKSSSESIQRRSSFNFRIIYAVGIFLFFLGAFINGEVVDNNGGKMPVNSLVAVEDLKHKKANSEIKYEFWIDKYEIDEFGFIPKTSYSLGDIISYVGIFILLISLIPYVYLNNNNKKRLISLLYISIIIFIIDLKLSKIIVLSIC